VKHFVVYTVMRLGLLLATFAVVSTVAVLILGQSATVWFVAMLVAAVISSLLSLKLLAGRRERFAETVEARAARAKGKFEQLRSREDAD
jgi:Na+/melibiose symporter-like transporter